MPADLSAREDEARDALVHTLTMRRMVVGLRTVMFEDEEPTMPRFEIPPARTLGASWWRRLLAFFRLRRIKRAPTLSLSERIPEQLVASAEDILVLDKLRARIRETHGDDCPARRDARRGL